MSKQWINDSAIYCMTCGTKSKSYFLGEDETNFCPCCGSGDIEFEDEEE